MSVFRTLIAAHIGKASGVCVFDHIVARREIVTVCTEFLSLIKMYPKRG